MPEKRIKILPGGPYEVSAGVPLKQALIEADSEGISTGWGEGKDYGIAPGESSHLCRCGHSKSKPFCDGSHVAMGFEGAEVAGHEPYLAGCTMCPGGEVNLLDNEKLCASVRFCDRGKGAWQAARDSAEAESCALTIEEVGACASGRLSLMDKQGRAVEPMLPQEISPIEDVPNQWRGPLWVKGGIPIEGTDGQAYEVRNRVTLCRCGESGNMPFCDISHLDCPHMEGLDE